MIIRLYVFANMANNRVKDQFACNKVNPSVCRKMKNI